jgi:hypothetical protein
MRIWIWESFWPWIRDGKNLDSESGINIPDPQHWLLRYRIYFQDLSEMQSVYDKYEDAILGNVSYTKYHDALPGSIR